MSDLVVTSQEGRVRTIRLNRPEKKNALSQELAWGVIEAVEEAARKAFLEKRTAAFAGN